VNIFFDEDTGTGVPLALKNVDVREVEYVSQKKKARIRKGTPDEDWIPWAGQNNYLVFSCNTGILEAEAQRELLIQERIGIVFLTSGQETKLQVLKLVLNKWQWLEQLWENEPRPFAFRISIRGYKKKIDLSGPPGPRTRSRRATTTGSQAL
jgi:hypothetical protein